MTNETTATWSTSLNDLDAGTYYVYYQLYGTTDYIKLNDALTVKEVITLLTPPSGELECLYSSDDCYFLTIKGNHYDASYFKFTITKKNTGDTMAYTTDDTVSDGIRIYVTDAKKDEGHYTLQIALADDKTDAYKLEGDTIRTIYNMLT